MNTNETNRGLPYALAGKRAWVAGHSGMVGSAIVRRLAPEGCEIVTVELEALDLRRQREVEAWFAQHKPQAVFLAAAKVGGILANDTLRGEFLYDNLAIETNIIEAARQNGVEKLLFLGSSCIYPKFAEQPMSEDALLTGLLEPTNEPYAIAKIAGLKLAENYRRQYGCDFISAMPTNLYGPGDNFDLASSHVMPALIRKAHEAKIKGSAEMVVWGTGTPKREFLHVDDCADALVYLMKNYSADQHVNIGSGEDISILDLTKLTADIVGFKGRISHDTTKPDGTPRKLLNVAKLKGLGWRPRIAQAAGIESTNRWFLENRVRK